MENDVTIRISSIMKHYGIESAADLSREIGINRTTVSHVLNRRNNASADFIQAIITRWSEIDARWLMTGKGNMFNGEIVTKATQHRPTSLRDANQDLFSSQNSQDNNPTRPTNNQEDMSNIQEDYDGLDFDEKTQPHPSYSTNQSQEDKKSDDLIPEDNTQKYTSEKSPLSDDENIDPKMKQESKKEEVNRKEKENISEDAETKSFQSEEDHKNEKIETINSEDNNSEATNSTKVEIEKVLIFYTDGTFEVSYPKKRRVR
jgi:hypothetical protein